MVSNKDINWIYDHIQDCHNQANGLEKSVLRDVLDLFEKAPEPKGCEYCTGDYKTFPTHCDGEAYITKLIPLPAIDLMTGEMEDTADPPFFTIRIQSDDMGEDFVPIRFCPKCGRELKAVE